MTRRQVRKFAIIAALLLILALLVGYYSFYRSTKQLSFNIAASVTGTTVPPTYMYSFAGNANHRMQRPIGVLADNGRVYVTDGVRHEVYVFDEAGKELSYFGSKETSTPLYLAKNPKDGNLYVSDRGARQMRIFSTAGKYLGDFNPHLPKNQLPTFNTFGVQWIPVAVAFAPDGTMYVTEILNGHRLLIFAPDGTFKKSVGTAGISKKPDVGQYYFQFPNGLMVTGGEVYVADSNNQRIQVFDLNGNFKRFIVTQGLPRGIAELDHFPSDTGKSPSRLVEIDTLAHDATIWSNAGEKLVSFGSQGVLEGQFNYPDGVSKGSENKIFIADTANGRVQVWGWPQQVSTVARIINPNNAWLCLTPLLLLPLLLLTRRRRFVATPDFVTGMVSAQTVDLMPGGRRKWLATEAEYEVIKPIEAQGVNMEELFEGVTPSESDARALMEKLDIDAASAATLVLAKRAKVFCTESAELRRLAKLLELDVVDCDEFARRYPRSKTDTADQDQIAS